MPSPLDQPESDTPSQTTTPDPQAQDQAQRLAIEYDQVAAQQATDQADETEQVHSLDVGGGNVVKLDKLGPMIINSDGTLSRIQNWQDLHPIEQERTVRLLVKKRNLVRLQKLDAENQDAPNAGEEKLSALKDSEAAEVEGTKASH